MPKLTKSYLRDLITESIRNEEKPIQSLMLGNKEVEKLKNINAQQKQTIKVLKGKLKEVSLFNYKTSLAFNMLKKLPSDKEKMEYIELLDKCLTVNAVKRAHNNYIIENENMFENSQALMVELKDDEKEKLRTFIL